MRFANQRLQNFHNSESGGITAFVLILFLIMVVGGGMAVDFMRQETMRADLQNALDRGVLSAASFKQGTDPEQILTDFLDTRSFRDYAYTLAVDSELGLNSRTVTADASVQINTFFLKIIGINQLTAVAHGVAEEAITNVEISLVLDVSGSMGRNGKLDKLKVAAKEFVDTVLTDTTREKTTLSIIPYTAQVDPGPLLAPKYNLNIWQNYDFCFAMSASDYLTTQLLSSTLYQQEQHWIRTGSAHECPGPGRTIMTMSNNNGNLKSMINNLWAGGYTASYAGMKWGVAMLDPATQPVIASLVNDGVVAASFGDRPAAYDDDDSLKVVVLMTDGVNTNHLRIKDDYYDDYSIEYWHTHSASSSRRELVVNQNMGDGYLQNICDRAKAAGITVYTIGFEVAGTPAEGKMLNCASSPNNAFFVEGVEISDAFQVIANDIDQLKLIQ